MVCDVQPRNSYLVHSLDLNYKTLGPKERLAEVRKRMQKYSCILERFVSPDATYPVFGRSIPYRLAVFQPLAMLAWQKRLPEQLPNGQVRAMLTAVMKRMYKGDLQQLFGQKPDADAKHEKRLPPDTIVAFVGQCENTREYPEGQKFGRIKLPAANPGEYEDGYVRLSNIDNSAAHLAMIQVSQKYAQYSGRGDVPVEILNELEDNIGELRSWSGR